MILRDRDANTNWEAQADATLEERTYTCQNWRADVVALMTSGGVLVNQVRYDPYGKPFGIAKTDLDADGDVDGTDSSLCATYHFASTMPYADWNWDGTKDLSDQSAFTSDYNADTGIGRGALGYAYSHANGASRKGYAGYEMDPVLTGAEGWESIYHVRNRVLLSQLGRWTRRDPLGYVDGMDSYRYGVAFTVRDMDESGLAYGIPGDGNVGCGIGGGVIAGSGDGCGNDGDDTIIDDQCGILTTCASDPYVIAALAYARNRCSTSDLCRSGWTLTCDPEAPGRDGSTDCPNCKVNVARNTDCRTLAHELVHVGDNCAHGSCGVDDCRGCERWICREARASYYSCCSDDQGVGVGQCVKNMLLSYKLTGRCRIIDDTRWNAIWNACTTDSEGNKFDCKKLKNGEVPPWAPPPSKCPTEGGEEPV